MHRTMYASYLYNQFNQPLVYRTPEIMNNTYINATKHTRSMRIIYIPHTIANANGSQATAQCGNSFRYYASCSASGPMVSIAIITMIRHRKTHLQQRIKLRCVVCKRDNGVGTNVKQPSRFWQIRPPFRRSQCRRIKRRWRRGITRKFSLQF